MLKTVDTARLRDSVETQRISISELARTSGVSRAQLGRILSGSRVRVRQGTLDKLAQALKVDPTEFLVGGVLQRFRALLAKQHGTIDFRGVGFPRLQRCPLADVYVDVSVREEEARSSEIGCRGSQRGSCVEEKPTAKPIPAIQCVTTYDRVVILGNPGAGKTTLLKYLAALQGGQEIADDEVPVYVRLAELSRALEVDPCVDVIRFVAARAAG